MPAQKRQKTKYPGVYFIEGKAVGTGKSERIYYITYRKNGRQIHEKAGRQFQDDMTPARAANLRTMKIEGKLPTNKERRYLERVQMEAIDNKWTFNKLWKEYKANKTSIKGIVTDENRFNKHIKPYFGEKEPKDLVPLDIDRIRLKLLKTKAPGTVKNVLEMIKRIINFGIKKRLCSGLGFTIEMPKVNNLRTEDLGSDQLKKLLEVIEKDTHPQAGPMMKMALFTGMRRGEMFKLKWEHIDFERGFIFIKDPKGGPDQKIPLNDAVRELLEKHPKAFSSYVFPGRGGHSRIDINKAVNAIKRKAGLPKDFRPLHGLRHVYASMLASSGQVDMYTLQKLLTHKSPQMTQRYAHLRDDTLKRASELAGELVNEAVRYKKSDKKDENS